MCILYWHKIMELKVLETRASLIQEKNEYRLVNSRVHSIVLKCSETMVEPRVNGNNFTIDNSLLFY